MTFPSIDELRPIAPEYLVRLLVLILDLLVSQSMRHDAAPIEDLLTSLADDHEVPRAVSEQILTWFGDTKDGKWNMDILAIVKEIGLGVLRNYRVGIILLLVLRMWADPRQHEPIERDVLITKWKAQVGDTFESSVTLQLLTVSFTVINY